MGGKKSVVGEVEKVKQPSKREVIKYNFPQIECVFQFISVYKSHGLGVNLVNLLTQW